MLFAVLLALCRAGDALCVGEHNNPDPISNMQPKFVQVMTRHGARTPQTANLPRTHRGYWVCDDDEAHSPRIHAAPLDRYRRFRQTLDTRLVDFPPNCRTGDLIIEGQTQHYTLGQYYRSYLFDTIGLFTEEPSVDQILARCSSIERTFRSAEGFLHGLFPPKSPNEILEIITDSSVASVLIPSTSYCQDYADMTTAWEQTEEYQNYYDESWDKLSDLAELLEMEQSYNNLDLMADWVGTLYCTDRTLPSIVTDEMAQLCLNITGYYLYNRFSQNPYVAGSYIVRDFLRTVDEVVSSNSSVKFSLLSSHDSTVAAVATLLGYTANRIPPFASHLLLELWVDSSDVIWIRFALNGVLIPLREFAGETLVKYSEFKERYASINEYCKDFPATISS